MQSSHPDGVEPEMFQKRSNFMNSIFKKICVQELEMRKQFTHFALYFCMSYVLVATKANER